MTRYPRLRDGSWLRRMYHERDMSLNDIAREVGCTNMTVQRNMVKLGIERRGQVQRNDLGRDLTARDVAVLEGELLGDGCLFKSKPGSDAYLEHGLGDSAHRDWLAAVIGGIGFETRTRDRDKDDGTGTLHSSHGLRTLAYPRLTELYERWYTGPHELSHRGTKRAPTDLRISPRALLHWHMGDGFVNGGSVYIATTIPEGDVGFTDRCRDVLLGALERDAGVTAHLKPSTGDIHIPREQEGQYFGYMADPPAGIKEGRFR